MGRSPSRNESLSPEWRAAAAQDRAKTWRKHMVGAITVPRSWTHRRRRYRRARHRSRWPRRFCYGSTRLTDTASLTATASHGTIAPNILLALHRRGVLPARVSARALGLEPLAQASRRQAGGFDAIDRNGRPASFRCAERRPCLAPLPRDHPGRHTSRSIS